MNPNIAGSEDTSNAFAPTHDFNIAQAFPVTDGLVRKVARERRRHQVEQLLHSKPLHCVAAVLIGVALMGLVFRR
jgi:hypothetical protein